MNAILPLISLLMSFSFCNINNNCCPCDNYLIEAKTTQNNENKIKIIEYSEEIISIIDYLNTYYNEYEWHQVKSMTTEDICGFKPIEMQSEDFEGSIIDEAVKELELDSSYGGCGPIAMMGILDYFSRFLGYHEIMNNSNSYDDKKQLALDVLSTVKTFEWGVGNDRATATFCFQYINGFNRLMNYYGLNDVLSASGNFVIIPDPQIDLWNIIVKNIELGLPLTFMSSGLSGSDVFGGHFVNVFGYEIWAGKHKETGEKVTKKFMVSRVNLARGDDAIRYCDAQILNDILIGLISYNIDYKNVSEINSSDFAQEFVNDNGDGQYYFYNKTTQVTTSQGEVLQTNRLRASYIENQYLVLSPNRANAGTAYIDIEFDHNVEKMIFDAALWSNNEGIAGQKFEIQYYDGEKWKTSRTIDLYKMNTKNVGMSTYLVLFPKTTRRIRFITTKQNPLIDRNKGRIVLDKIKIYYN